MESHLAVVPIVSVRPIDENAPTFDDFWLLYPRRVAKLDARKAWTRLNSAQVVECLTALVAWRKVWMARGELEFVPHAATWLRGERWEDELPTPASSPVSTHQSHQVASLAPMTPRTSMPDHVRDLLAKLRK